MKEAFLSGLHPFDTLLPAFDHATATERKAERVRLVAAGVELGSVLEPAGVVNEHRFPAVGELLARACLKNSVAETVLCSNFGLWHRWRGERSGFASEQGGAWSVGGDPAFARVLSVKMQVVRASRSDLVVIHGGGRKSTFHESAADPLLNVLAFLRVSRVANLKSFTCGGVITNEAFLSLSAVGFRFIEPGIEDIHRFTELSNALFGLGKGLTFLSGVEIGLGLKLTKEGSVVDREGHDSIKLYRCPKFVTNLLPVDEPYDFGKQPGPS